MAIKLRLQAARDAASNREIGPHYHDIENSHVDNGPSGRSDLMNLRSALLELRGELVKKQSELLARGMDIPQALSIGAQAEAIMLDLAELADGIAGLAREVHCLD